MRDPIRLRDDPKASKYCRQLLREESETEPFQYDVLSGLHQFRVTIRGSLYRSGVRVSRWFRSEAFAKLPVRAPIYGLITGFALVAFGGSAVWIHRQNLTEALKGPSSIESHGPDGDRRERAPTRTAPPPPIVEPSEETPADVLPVETSVARPFAPSKAAKAGEGHQDLVGETRDIALLRAAAQQDPARALAIAQEGVRKFPDGFFSQEREAIAIRSLVKLGRTAEARARAARFLASYPRGPAAESIRTSVGLSPP